MPSSGVQRTTPLIYSTDGDRVTLIASNYGGTRIQPGLNVKANPMVTLLGGGFEGRLSVRRSPEQNVNGSGRLPSNGTPATSNTNHPPNIAKSPFSHLDLPVSRRSAASTVHALKRTSRI